MKCEGLDDEQAATASVPPSGFRLTGLVQHTAEVDRNWERAALIKARPCAGDREAADRFLRDLSPFVWRKYLDYAAVADVHAMKQQIHAYRGHGEIAANAGERRVRAQKAG